MLLASAPTKICLCFCVDLIGFLFLLTSLFWWVSDSILYCCLSFPFSCWIFIIHQHYLYSFSLRLCLSFYLSFSLCVSFIFPSYMFHIIKSQFLEMLSICFWVIFLVISILYVRKHFLFIILSLLSHFKIKSLFHNFKFSPFVSISFSITVWDRVKPG